MSPHKTSYNPSSEPDAGLEKNYCRNPSSDTAIWCYTTDPNIRWDYCQTIGNEHAKPAVQ